MSRELRWLLQMLLLSGIGARLPAETAVWRLDAQHSAIEVAVRSTFEAFVCRVGHFEAEMEIDRVTHRVEKAAVSFAVAELKTGRLRRDKHLQDWVEGAQYPTVMFRLDQLTATAPGSWEARGTVTFHGIERGVSIPVRSLLQGSLHTFDGQLEVDYRDFGLPLIRKYLVLAVDPHLTVRFHLQGREIAMSGGEEKGFTPAGETGHTPAGP